MCKCHCMLCNRDGRVFNINGVYGNEIRTIKEELLSLYGDEVNEYLNENDVICAVCETLLNWVVKILDLWYNRMKHHPSCYANPKMRLQPVCYGKIWEAFSSEIQKEDFNDLPRRSPNLLGNSPLLVAKRESDYDSVTEEILSKSFSSGKVDRPSSSCSDDREVEETLVSGGRRRKRRKRRSDSRRKTNQSRVSSVSRTSSRTKSSRRVDAPSRFSSFSARSTTTVVTRSCTRMMMEEVQRQIDLLPDDFIIRCDVEGCENDEQFETLEDLQEHKHDEHNMFYLYECEQCRTEYVCERDYDRHINEIHDECYNHCLLCGIPMYSRKELVAHHRQHALHSVKCLYCDRSFLDKCEYQEHKKVHHCGKEKKTRNQRARRLILEQANYDYECTFSD